MAQGRSRPSGDLAAKAFFYSRTPMLLVDAAGMVADINAACRELMGLDIAGCKGQHHSYLSERIRDKVRGELFPPDGTARKLFPAGSPDPAARPLPQLDTADLRAAVSVCRYRSTRHGPVSLRVSELPCVDTPTGACIGSAVSLGIEDPRVLAAFRKAADMRLGHEVMWEVYAASYDRILPELPFYREVVERHVAAMSAAEIRTVLDLGAGTGTVALRLLEAGKRVTAVDINRAMLEKMYAKLEAGAADRLTVIEDTAESLPHLPGGAFDGVTVLLAFFDMDHPLAGLREAQRLLKPGGSLVVTEPRACFNVAELMAAAEDALRRQGVMDRLADDWKRIQTVAPLVRDAVREVGARKAAAPAGRDWHAEAILDGLREAGYEGLSFRESHLGNCATVAGRKPLRPSPEMSGP